MNKQCAANWDAVTGLSSVLFGLIYGLAAWNMPRAAFGNPMDPLYFPLGIAGLAVLVGVILVAKSNFNASIQAVKNLLAASKTEKNNRKRILYTCLAAVGYAILFDRLGYVLSTFFFMFAMLTITSGWRRWRRSVVVAILFSVCIYLIFSTLLNVSLPPLPFVD